MKSISFDNPYWLLLAIPLLAAVLVPYFISVSRDNKNKSWTVSLAVHIAIVLSLALASAGLVHTTVMTRTKVYVVADVSYSTSRDLDTIDEYIEQIDKAMPQNSRLGIVCFGKNAKVLTSSGTAIKSVREAKVDDSGTDIAAALDYTATLFAKNEIKRIVLITDGSDTTYDGSVVAAIERLAAKDIKIDAVYVDSNLGKEDREVQISGVNFTPSTYLNHKSELSVLVEANQDSDAILDLYVKPEGDDEYVKINTTVLRAEKGINLASFPLPTAEEGVFDYKVEISATDDTSSQNNSYIFTQQVAGKRSVLLIGGNQSELMAIRDLYAMSADIDLRHITPATRDVPYSVEALSKYDEIILASVDIREINNINAFIDSVDIVVSQYGKSLITVGDLKMQNKDDHVFERLEELLPVNFGNSNKDSKLYTIVLDISRSMFENYKFDAAKDAAVKLLSILGDDDHVALITLAGEVVVEQTPDKPLGECREDLYRKIANLERCQGTFIGAAMDRAYKTIKDLPFEEKQVMLISDGLSYIADPFNSVDIASSMRDDGIAVSTVHIMFSEKDSGGATLLDGIASAGGGNCYTIRRPEDVADVVFATIADDLTESVVEGSTAVNIEIYRDDVLEGIRSLPNVLGYVNSKPKLDSTMVLSVDYKKNASTTVSVPLYSYREHGNGRVATFTSSLSGNWLNLWRSSVKQQFFGNVLSTNTPRERIDYPYVINFEYGGTHSTIEMLPSYLNPKAKAKIKLTTPSGEVYEEDMIFNLNRYFVTLETTELGKYHIELTYTYGTNTFKSNTYYNVSYYPEYNTFAAHDLGSIHDFMRGRGRIYIDGNVDLSVNRAEVDTYEISFRLPLLIAAVVMFVFDVFIRKFKWTRRQDRAKNVVTKKTTAEKESENESVS